MSWVLLSLRKSELKALHAQYVAEDLQISREERQAARRYQYEQICVQNDMQADLRELRSKYKEDRKALYDAQKQINAQQSSNTTAPANNMYGSVFNTNGSQGTTGQTGTTGTTGQTATGQTTTTGTTGQTTTGTTTATNPITVTLTGGGKSVQSLDEVAHLLEESKEDFEEQKNFLQSYWEDGLSDIEQEANDTETMYEEDKVRVETQMEAVAQELQAVSEAISQQIQNETIKIS